MRTPTRALVCVALLTAVAAPARGHADAKLTAIFDQWHQWRLEQYPEMAMARGDYSRADRITDVSRKAIAARQQATRTFLDQLHDIDPAKLDRVDRLDYELFDLMLGQAVLGQKFPTWLSPIGGRFGPHQQIPQMAERVRFQSVADYENYLERLEQVPRMVDDLIDLLGAGAEAGWTPPAVTMTGVAEQFNRILGGGLDPLSEPFSRVPGTVGADRVAALKKRFDEVSLPAVRGAMQKLSGYVTEQYLPRCRQSIAARALPDGEAFYAYQLRIMTTTPMTAPEIHELGLREVARIRGEMMQVIRRSDFMESHAGAASDGDEELFADFIAFLRSDPRFYHESGESLLCGYRDICKQVDPWLVKLFGRLPRLPYGVREIPAFMAASQTTAYYDAGDIRNAEPGWFYANTYALDQRPSYEMIPLALHEAVPGHHLQIALAQELDDLPEFRKDTYITAFGEGWALYAERLGIEMGLYQDPYDDFGRLLYEMWRACRLVVDPGMHALDWSREQAVQFMLQNTALSELNINNEVDRYIAWPGQACAYKIGELKIRDLRKRAEQALGEGFNLREFHDQVLGAGALPLPILEKQVMFWVNTKRFRAYD